MSLLQNIKDSKLKLIKNHSATSFSITYTLPDCCVLKYLRASFQPLDYTISTNLNCGCQNFVNDLKRSLNFRWEYRSITNSSYKHPFMQSIYKKVMDDIEKFKQTQEYKNSFKKTISCELVKVRSMCLEADIGIDELKNLVDEVFGHGK